jgi:hypothetical protein
MTTSGVSVQELMAMSNKIQNMDKQYQIEILDILFKYQTEQGTHIINDNEFSGAQINLSDLNKDAIDRLVAYISFYDVQMKSLLHSEELKQQYKKELK